MATRWLAMLLIICRFCFSLSFQVLPFSAGSLPVFSVRGAISVPKAQKGSSDYVALPDLIGKGKLQSLLSQRGVLSKEIPCMEFRSTGIEKLYV
jgi:hypothetical protein